MEFAGERGEGDHDERRRIALRDGGTAEGADTFDIATMRRARPLYVGRLATGLVLLGLAGLVVRAFAVGKIDWVTVGRYLTWPTILAGLQTTIVMAVAAMALGLVLGVLAAVARASDNPVLRTLAVFYAWLFRGTPLILQLLLWFNIALVFPVIGIPGVFSERAVILMTPFTAALLGLGLNEGAYVSEIVRAGMVSVDRGQFEAAQSIGMPYFKTLRRIILPQAMRVIVPPLGNQFIAMVKTTSLASVIELPELLHSAESLYYANSKVIELLIVAACWYLVVVTVLSVGQALLERRFSRGVR